MYSHYALRKRGGVRISHFIGQCLRRLISQWLSLLCQQRHRQLINQWHSLLCQQTAPSADQSVAQPALSADRSVHPASQRRGCEGGYSQYQSADEREAAATVSDGSHSAATAQRPSARAAVRSTAHYLTTTMALSTLGNSSSACSNCSKRSRYNRSRHNSHNS